MNFTWLGCKSRDQRQHWSMGPLKKKKKIQISKFQRYFANATAKWMVCLRPFREIIGTSNETSFSNSSFWDSKTVTFFWKRRIRHYWRDLLLSMEELWQDPLLFTDVSWQKQHLETAEMEKTGNPHCDDAIKSIVLNLLSVSCIKWWFFFCLFIYLFGVGGGWYFLRFLWAYFFMMKADCNFISLFFFHFLLGMFHLGLFLTGLDFLGRRFLARTEVRNRGYGKSKRPTSRQNNKL